MDKVRIPLNVEPELKEWFTERVTSINPNISLTQALRNIMYNVLEMKDKNLISLISGADTFAPIMEAYAALVETAKHEGILPQNYKYTHQYLMEVFVVLREYYIEGESIEKTNAELEPLLKKIKNSHLYLRDEDVVDAEELID